MPQHVVNQPNINALTPHVEALRGGGIVDAGRAAALAAALHAITDEIRSGSFASYARGSGAEDVHERYPEKVAELQRLQEALYETSKYLLYHNPARPHVPEERR